MPPKDSIRPGPNPGGLCRCGCGQPTPLAVESRKKGGLVRGQPVSYLRGHNTRLSPVEYLVDERGCWVWQRARGAGGYGQLVLAGRTIYAHRLYYERARGPIPPGFHLDHLCQNPPCVNPDHMEIVTAAVNMQRSGWARFIPEEVRAIRALHATGVITCAQLARDYGVGFDCIRNMVLRRTWKNVA